MKENARANNQAHKIVDAAAEVVASQGVHKLTIDAVAKQAGLSKGGVLYHFPTKEALLTGMLEQLIQTMETRRGSHPTKSGLEAMLHTVDLDSESDRPISLAILAVSAQQPNLLAPAKDYYQAQIKKINSETNDQELTGILLMALEGLRLLTMLDINPWSKAQTRKILKRMHNIGHEVNS